MKEVFTLASVVFFVACGDVDALQAVKPTDDTSSPDVVYKPCVSEEVDEGVLITCADDEEPTLVRHGKSGRDGAPGQAGRDGVDGVDGETVEVTHTVETVVEHTTETVREVEVDSDTLVYMEDGTALGELVDVVLSPWSFITELADGEIIGVGSLSELPVPMFFYASNDCSGEPIALGHTDTRGQLSTVFYDGVGERFVRRGERLARVDYLSRRVMGSGTTCQFSSGFSIYVNEVVDYGGLDDVSFVHGERPYIGK